MSVRVSRKNAPRVVMGIPTPKPSGMSQKIELGKRCGKFYNPHLPACTNVIVGLGVHCGWTSFFPLRIVRQTEHTESLPG